MSSSLPRVLCLHGGGANARVFGLQCRALIARLAPSLRLVFADAPFVSAPHDDVALVYGDYGPFRYWLRLLPGPGARPPPGSAAEADADADADAEAETGADADAAAAADADADATPDDADAAPDADATPDAAAAAARRIVAACRRAMAADDGTGPWLAVLGFSQGAKVAASLLWAQQRARAAGLPPLTPFAFGVLLAGSPPLVWLDDRVPPPPRHVADAALPVGAFDDWPADGAPGPHVLDVPSLHVHGLLDPGLPHHRQLRAAYCRPGTARLVEWPGAHRMPLRTDDVEAVAAPMLELARQTGGGV